MAKPQSLPLSVRYLLALQKNPLLTKSITGAALAVLNEIIARVVSRQLNITQIKNLKITHPVDFKLVLFALYSFIVATPVSHYGYQWLNKIFKPPLSPRQKILQIITSMATITPVASTLFVAFVALMNMKPAIQSISREEINRAIANIKESWKKSLLTVLKSSWLTGPIAVAFCQKFVPVELWTVFTTVCYFFLGTAQNTMLKIRTKKQQEYLKKRDEVVKDVTKETEKNEDKVDAESEVLRESTSTGATKHE